MIQENAASPERKNMFQHEIEHQRKQLMNQDKPTTSTPLKVRALNSRNGSSNQIPYYPRNNSHGQEAFHKDTSIDNIQNQENPDVQVVDISYSPQKKGITAIQPTAGFSSGQKLVQMTPERYVREEAPLRKQPDEFSDSFIINNLLPKQMYSQEESSKKKTVIEPFNQQTSIKGNQVQKISSTLSNPQIIIPLDSDESEEESKSSPVMFRKKGVEKSVVASRRQSFKNEGIGNQNGSSSRIPGGMNDFQFDVSPKKDLGGVPSFTGFKANQNQNKLAPKPTFDTEADVRSIDANSVQIGLRVEKIQPFEVNKYANYLQATADKDGAKENDHLFQQTNKDSEHFIQAIQNIEDNNNLQNINFSDHKEQFIELPWHQGGSPDQNRLSDAPILRNNHSSERDLFGMDSHTEHADGFIDEGKEKQSLIAEQDEGSESFNKEKKKRVKNKLSNSDNNNNNNNGNTKPIESLDQVDDDIMKIPSTHKELNQVDDSENQIFLKQDDDRAEDNDGANMKQEQEKQMYIQKGYTGQFSQKNQVTQERLNTRQSQTQSKVIVPQLNKFELEQKKERQIQKFCRKFFKDKLKHRSGVPTLTQNHRTMNLEQETPNQKFRSGFNVQKEGLLNDELQKELFNIEEHQKYRLVMDQFLKKFSRSPKEAIHFLIEKQLCDDREEDIAYMLLTTEGLNKEQLGVFFGSNKEKNQLILEAFCSLMDFRDLRFDEALRLFLSRFRIPGEAQQIDRIIQKFTKVYMNDNVDIFKDEDTPYILCYSAIMLNVDAHSEKIEKKNKMTKATFVQNNLSCTRNSVSAEFLEMLYDNIVKEKIETKVDYIEKIYSRIPIESMTRQFDGQHRMRIIKALQTGANFLKYGRKGKPHMRKVWLNETRDKIIWMEVDLSEELAQPGKKGPIQQVTAAAEKQFKERHINLKDVTDLALGSNTTEVMRRNNVPSEFDQFCFSIITCERTLDLKSSDMDSKFQWIAFIYNHLNDLRVARKNRLIQMNAARNSSIDRISEIWRIDIFSKWDDHWDYTSSKPKHISKIENAGLEKQSIFSKICSCLSSPGSSFKTGGAGAQSSPVRKNNNSKKNSANKSFSQVNGSVNSQHLNSPNSHRDYEELELMNHSNKSLLLITLWKIGMPKWVRKTIWPLTIGNRLEITENLYSILLKQVNTSSSNQSFQQSNPLISASIQKMKEDLESLKSKVLHSSLNKEQKSMLENVLGAFIFYRPDIGYIKEAMPNLAAVLVHHIQDEFTIFRCFINLLHSHHFLTFFRGEMSEIKWRVQFFNEQLQNRLPLVLQHLRALDLSSELFIMPWFLNLFSSTLDLETVFRIWDNFLLQGELFAFKAGIAFIEYFHLEFKLATFDDAFTLLKNPPEDIFCEDLYFDIIEDIKIPLRDFTDRVDQQNVAKLAPFILQQLL